MQGPAGNNMQSPAANNMQSQVFPAYTTPAATEAISTMHQQCPQRPDQPCHSVPSTCPTCGASRFCVSCGAPVIQNFANCMRIANDPSMRQQTQVSRQVHAAEQPVPQGR